MSTPFGNNWNNSDQSHIIVAQIYVQRQNHFIAAISNAMTASAVLTGDGSISAAAAVVDHSSKISPKLTFILDLFLPPDGAEENLLGLEDVYEKRWVRKYGEHGAKVICLGHVISAIVDHHWSRIVKLVALVKLIKWLW